MAAAFGLTFTQLTAGRAEARLPWRPELSHAPDVFQANPIAALADTTGVAAGITVLPPGSTAATVDYTAKFLTEARGDHLIARARVLRPGTTLTVAAVDIAVTAHRPPQGETLRHRTGHHAKSHSKGPSGPRTLTASGQDRVWHAHKKLAAWDAHSGRLVECG